MGKVYKETYFQHDRYARQDPKIKKMLTVFRKENELKAKAAVCIYWWIVEDMHTNAYPKSELDAFADDYRCDVDFLKSILEDFELFRVENDCYVSDRVLRNLKEQEEKSNKAKRSAQRRWNKSEEKTENPEKAEQTSTDTPEYNEELVMQIIGIYNKKFNKSQIVSGANKQKIFKINTENNLTLDVWEKVFSNAKRGWDIGDKKNVPPSLKKILEEWDSFASDDYFLAPNREAIAQAHEQKLNEKREQDLKTKQQNKEWTEKKDELKNAIKDKRSAMEYVHYCLPIQDEVVIKQSYNFKQYSREYDFTFDEYVQYLQDIGENLLKTRGTNEKI
jgi:hypothetical protein